MSAVQDLAFRALDILSDVELFDLEKIVIVTGCYWSLSLLISCICLLFSYSMEIKSARSVFERLGKTGCDRSRGGPVNKVCSYWLAGKCTKNPCRFLHTKAPQPQLTKRSHLLVLRPPLKQVPLPPKRVNTWTRRSVTIAKKTPIPSTEEVKLESCLSKTSPISLRNKAETVTAKKTPTPATGGAKCESGLVKADKASSISQRNKLETAIVSTTPIPDTQGVKSESGFVKESPTQPSNGDEGQNKSLLKVRTKVCQSWLSGTCVYGDLCEYSHSWFCGNGFSMVAKLEGHSNAVTGIALPSGSDKLYSGGSDRAVRVWDCNTGECKHFEYVPGEVGCLVSEGPRLYMGLENVIAVSDLGTSKQFRLNGPVGQVYAMSASEDMLYAGTQDGTILAWKFSPEFSSVELVASMNGHTQGVTSLTIGPCKRLFSGSMDNTIRVWDLNSFQCMQTLQGHAGVVTSLLTWNQWLLSCSLDGTVKAWAESESRELELVHSVREDYGFLTLCGVVDAEGKPILLCSCGDNTVRLYDLPLFTERGRIFSKQEVRSILSGPHGIFFTGDASGELTVWKLV